jgi:hypothetical protein
MKKIILAILAISFLAACEKDDIDLPQELGVPFAIKVNQTVKFEEEDMKITLLEITDDSRCPISVECILAGHVVAAFKVEKDGEAIIESLTDYPYTDPTLSTEFEAFGHLVKFVEMTPEKDIEPIPQEDYALKIEVE